MAARKFKYVGDPNEVEPQIPKEYPFLGYVFKKGRPKAVDDEHVAGKLAGHNHFEEVTK